MIAIFTSFVGKSLAEKEYSIIHIHAAAIIYLHAAEIKHKSLHFLQRAHWDWFHETLIARSADK